MNTEDMPAGAPRPVLAYFGHHRCASSWIVDIVGAVCRELRLRHVSVHNAREFGHDLGRFVRERRVDVLTYTNAEYRYAGQVQGLRGFHVVRDPRDVAVSAYFSHLHSHRVDAEWPELAGRRERLGALSVADGLMVELEALAWQFGTMRDWEYGDQRILELRMEDVTAHPYEEFLRVFRFLDVLDERRFALARRCLHVASRGLRVLEGVLGDRVSVPVGLRRLPTERLLGIIWEREFRTMTNGRTRGEEDASHHYRKGVAGDWRSHFTARHEAYFLAHYGDLLARLGYDRPSEAEAPLDAAPSGRGASGQSVR
jgi:hypothetical protein